MRKVAERMVAPAFPDLWPASFTSHQTKISLALIPVVLVPIVFLCGSIIMMVSFPLKGETLLVRKRTLMHTRQ